MLSIYVYPVNLIYCVICKVSFLEEYGEGVTLKKETKPYHWRTCKQYTAEVTRLFHRRTYKAECVRSAPLGTPRAAGRIRGSGCRRRAGASLLLAGDNTFEDGLGIINQPVCCVFMCIKFISYIIFYSEYMSRHINLKNAEQG